MSALIVHGWRWINWSLLLLVSAIFGLLAWVGISLAAYEGGNAVVWLANAFLVAVILRSKKVHVPIYLTGAFAANIALNLVTGDPLIPAIIPAAINQFEVILIWLLMQRLGLPRPDMERLSDLGKFCLVGGVVAPLASGLLAGLLISSETEQPFLLTWLQWASTDGLGILLLSPAVMVVIDLVKPTQKASSKSRLPATANTSEWLVIQLFTLVSAITIFGFLNFQVFFLVAPIVLLNAFRLGTRGTSVSIGLIAVVVVICAALETGPFHAGGLSMTGKLFTMQILLLSCFAVGMPTAAMLAEMVRIRQSLRVHREVRDSMLENMSEVIFRTNVDLEWQFLNPAWEKLTGRSAQESLGRNVAEIFDSDGFTLLQFHLDPIRNGSIKRSRFEGSIRHENGSKVDVEFSFSRLMDEDEGFVGIVGSIRDVTERTQMEQKLVAARVGAERAADAKTRFLANMSHEIRTPMNGVLGFAQLLLDSKLPSEQEYHAQMILDSGISMMRLLNNILDISKVEAGHTNCTIASMSARQMLESCVGLMRPIANQKQLGLYLRMDETVPDQILADADHLRQIILNLLGNAVKFTQTGAVTLTVEADKAVAGATNIHVFVEDTGIGIPSDRLEAIFAPFEQAAPDTSRTFGGSGLGLTISRQLASVIGGMIEVCSTEGNGTTFHLQFSVGIESYDIAGTELPTDQPLIAGWNEPVDHTATKVRKGKILLAEDHDINQILIAGMIKKLGYQTVLAVNGREAVEKVQAAVREKSPFDLVLMDVQMPVLDGYQATKAIRSNGYSKERLPILAITANAYPEDVAHCLQSGMQGHIVKPVMLENLRSSLQDWIIRK